MSLGGRRYEPPSPNIFGQFPPRFSFLFKAPVRSSIFRYQFGEMQVSRLVQTSIKARVMKQFRRLHTHTDTNIHTHTQTHTHKHTHTHTHAHTHSVATAGGGQTHGRPAETPPRAHLPSHDGLCAGGLPALAFGHQQTEQCVGLRPHARLDRAREVLAATLTAA